MISVIIPVNNGVDFLERCIRSVICGIDPAADEILIVDDASADGTDLLAKKLVDQYPDTIRYFRMEKMSGPSATRNMGIAHANGKYISFIDSDDYIDSDMIARLYEEAERTGADMACCGYWQEEERKTVPCVAKRYAVFNTQECLAELLGNETIGNYVWNKLYRREIFDDLSFIEGEIYEDIRIMHQIISRCKKVVVLPECKYHYIKRKGSLTFRPSGEDLLLQYRVTKERNEFIAQKYPALEQAARCNTLRKSVLIYSRLARGRGWKECRMKFQDIYDDIVRMKPLLRYLPLEYRMLGNLIVYIPCFHGFVMSGR